MKKLVLAILATSMFTVAHAGVGVFAGLTYTFQANNGVGFTVQATSSRKEDQAIAAAGISFYPFAQKPAIGIPVGVGYQGSHAAGLISYDFLLKGISVSGGYVNTKSTSGAPPQIDGAN